MSKNNKTVTLVTLAFMIALEIILTRFLSVDVAGIARIGFGFIPVAMVAIMYGPWFAGGAYALGDILGMLIFPKGAYFPGFTLTACLTGIIFGLILYKRDHLEKVSAGRSDRSRNHESFPGYVLAAYTYGPGVPGNVTAQGRQVLLRDTCSGNTHSTRVE